MRIQFKIFQVNGVIIFKVLEFPGFFQKCTEMSCHNLFIIFFIDFQFTFLISDYYKNVATIHNLMGGGGGGG